MYVSNIMICTISPQNKSYSFQFKHLIGLAWSIVRIKMCLRILQIIAICFNTLQTLPALSELNSYILLIKINTNRMGYNFNLA